MAEQVAYVYLRLAAGARHSQVDFDQIEQLADKSALQNDRKDQSVYFFALPQDIDDAQANRIISALVTMPHIDEAWKNESMAILPPAPGPD